MKANSLAWKAENAEQVLAAHNAYYKKNLQESRQRATAWSAANRGKKAASTKKWKDANPEASAIHRQNRRALKISAGGVLSRGLAEKLFNLQKGMCPCCKQPLGDNYHLDHIIPLALGGSNADDNIQLLRQHCNGQKGKKDPLEFMRSRGFLL